MGSEFTAVILTTTRYAEDGKAVVEILPEGSGQPIVRIALPYVARCGYRTADRCQARTGNGCTAQHEGASYVGIRPIARTALAEAGWTVEAWEDQNPGLRVDPEPHWLAPARRKRQPKRAK